MLIKLPTYPFTDLPNHLAESTIYKYRNDSSSVLSSAYQITIIWYQSTIAHVVLGSLFPDVVWSYRVLYILYVISLPLVVFLIAKKHSWNTCISLLSFLVLWNFAAIWGFSGYTFSIPLVLLYFYIHLNYLSKRSVSNGLYVCIILLILYWFHHLAFLFAGLCFICIEIYDSLTGRYAKSMLIKWLPLLPTCLFFIIWMINDPGFHAFSFFSFLKEYYQFYFIQSLGRRLFLLLTIDGRAIAQGLLGHIVALLFSAAIVIPVIVCGYRYKKHPFQITRLQFATLIFTGAAFLCFWVLPSNLPGQAFLYKRFSVFFLVGLIIVLSWVVPALWKNFPPILVVSAVLMYSILWFHYFIQFYPISLDFTKFYPRGSEFTHSTVASIIDSPDYRGKAVLIHYNNYQIIWNHGVAPTKLNRYRFGLVKEKKKLPLYIEWVKLVNTLAGVKEIIDSYSRMDYIISQGKRPYQILSKRPDYIEIRRLNDWRLYKKEKQYKW